jgi:hypothetical protein
LYASSSIQTCAARRRRRLEAVAFSVMKRRAEALGLVAQVLHHLRAQCALRIPG